MAIGVVIGVAKLLWPLGVAIEVALEKSWRVLEGLGASWGLFKPSRGLLTRLGVVLAHC